MSSRIFAIVLCAFFSVFLSSPVLSENFQSSENQNTLISKDVGSKEKMVLHAPIWKVVRHFNLDFFKNWKIQYYVRGRYYTVQYHINGSYYRWVWHQLFFELLFIIVTLYFMYLSSKKALPLLMDETSRNKFSGIYRYIHPDMLLIYGLYWGLTIGVSLCVSYIVVYGMYVAFIILFLPNGVF